MLTQETVQHIARLARLNLSDIEAADFSRQLSAILQSFNEISEVDTTGVEPLVTPTDIVSRWRVDQAKSEAAPSELFSGQLPSTVDELLQNAPEKAGHLFKVPPVV